MDKMKKEGMRLIILDILQNEKLHGYGISEKIEELYGIKKPSSGIIYPSLRTLKKSNLIELYGEGKRDKKVYQITEKGIKYLQEHEENLKKIKNTLKNLGEFHKLGGHKLMKELSKTIKNIHKLDDVEKQNLSKILNRTYEELEELLEGKVYE